MGTYSRPMTELLSRRSGLMRWSLAGAFGLALHGGALWWLVPTSGPEAAVAAPEAVVMIDLPPEPELPPLESVEQMAVEEVAETLPEEVITRPPEPELAEVLPAPEEIETVDTVEDLAEAPSEPETLPPSEVAIPLPPIPPPEMVETAEVKPKPEPKKPERKKPAPKKPPEVQPPPADAQAAGAGAGREVADVLAAYRSSIRRAIVGKRRASDADGATGRATVSLSIGRDGSIIGLSVGGGTTVAAAAERLIRRVGSFPPVPQALDAPFKVTVPIEFKTE
ncbi:energy transducer TonB [Pleomorphomonas sp. PLEO]|uniref:energy transducer TonB family protein n=1 Tax=Pleomorphomonas sp. PLEO TaxID=3239306 RepID=UPI00351F09FE